tara:strand:+ start:114 stop:248 length:135 start_codon:yes stop_codon:yes gene_type:complete
MKLGFRIWFYIGRRFGFIPMYIKEHYSAMKKARIEMERVWNYDG